MGRMRLRIALHRSGWLVAALATTDVTGIAAQQPDTTAREHVLKAAGPRYQASGLHRLLFGREYRSLWSTPMSVPVLDLRTFAGGLKPVSKGGGQQTRSLLLTARDGREFFFRSVDKDPSATLPPELRATVAGDVVRDQTSSALPTGPLVVGPLLDCGRNSSRPISPLRASRRPRSGRVPAGICRSHRLSGGACRW